MSGKVLAKFELHLLTAERKMGRKDADRGTLVDLAEAVFIMVPMVAVSLVLLLQVIFLIACMAESII